MPTGYTAQLAEGEQSFPDFVLSCARNFGALIEMRDLPADAPIPEQFKTTNYHATIIFEAEAALRDLRMLPVKECARRGKAQYEQAMREWAENTRRVAAQRARFQTMWNTVRDWDPPSSDHTGLRDFMYQQLNLSLSTDWDGLHPPKKPTLLSGNEWRDAELERLEGALNHHTDAQEKEKRSVARRNRWLQQLRDSLNEWRIEHGQ